MTRPFFSVVIPTFNRRDVVTRAIDSVLAQDCKDFELIVVDDGSNDETYEFISKSYQGRLSIYRIENQGVSAARNYAVKHSHGKFLAFLDSDDEWQKEKLQKQKGFLSNNDEAEILHCDEIWIRNGKRVNQMKKHRKEGGDIFIRSLELCLISPSAVVLKRELYEKFSGFDESFIVCEDYDLWLKISANQKVHFLDDALLLKYGGHEDQLSRKFFAMDYWRIRSIHYVLNNIKLNNNKKTAAINCLLKKADILLKGYLKHNNMDNYAIVEKMRDDTLLMKDSQ